MSEPAGEFEAENGGTVYVIVGEAGGWELRDVWVAGVHGQRRDAERWAAEVTVLARAVADLSDWLGQRAAIQKLVERDSRHGDAELLEKYGPNEPMLPYQLEIFAMTGYRIEEHEVL